jgi:ribosome maturation protein SDO1
MTENTIARIKIDGKHFEVLVEDIAKALKFKKTGEGDINEFLAIEEIFTDSKKGDRASEEDLKKAFGSNDFVEIVKKIITRGEVQVPVEYKQKELGERGNQIVDFFIRNAVDPRSDRPYTRERIESAIKESGVNITNKPIESQIKEVTEKLAPILPLKIESKKLTVTVPAQYTGSAYGVLQNYKESEEWLNNGDLKIILNVPNGLIMEFYDKLNSATHGSAMSEELK